MPLILKNFSDKNTISGIWRITETEEDLFKLYTPSRYEILILEETISLKRKIEILATRALIKELGLNISITYNDRKPISNKGHISISHSYDLVCIIWHLKKEVTIDIEKINNRILRIADRAFSESERFFAGEDIKKNILLWNCKECVFKICNKSNISFKENIRVYPFELNNNTIFCDFYKNEETVNLKLNWLEIDEYTCVWGVS